MRVCACLVVAAVLHMVVDDFYESWLAELRIILFFRLERQCKGALRASRACLRAWMRCVRASCVRVCVR